MCQNVRLHIVSFVFVLLSVLASGFNGHLLISPQDAADAMLKAMLHLQNDAIDCPKPWFRLHDQCFLMVGGKFPSKSGWRNWASARDYCSTQAPGGSLAHPNNIKDLADNIKDKGFQASWYTFWLAGSDLSKEGNWHWFDGSRITNGWRQGEPNDAGGEDCIGIGPSWGANSLIDMDCQELWPFVCERKTQEKCLDSLNTRCDNISTQQTPNEQITTESTNDNTGQPSSINKPTPPNIYNGLYLYEASANGDVASVNKSLAAVGTNISWQNPDKQGATALHAAARYNHRTIVIALLDAGAKINIQDDDGLTPLHYASTFGSFESVVVLTIRGAGVDNPDKTSESTAMHKAAWHNHVFILRVLLDNGAKINHQNYWGQTPLFIASFYGSFDAVYYLILHDAKVDIPDNYGVTALHMAAMENHTNIVTALLDAGANINQQDDIGWTPLSHASDYGSYEAVAVLIGKGAIVDISDERGYTPLHRSTKHNNPAIITALLEAGADRNRKTDTGATPIYLASGVGNIAAVNILITYEAKVNKTYKLVFRKTDLNTPDEDGFTALHLAAEGNHLGIAEVLLQKGADASKQDKWGRTPTALAHERGHQEIAEIINRFTRTTDKINN